MNQLTSFDEAVGKTIKKIFDDYYSLYFVFEDGAFLIIRSNKYDAGDAPFLDDEKINLTPKLCALYNNDDLLVQLGAYSAEERETDLAKIKRLNEEAEKARKMDAEIEKEKRDKREYARLKKKFESK